MTYLHILSKDKGLASLLEAALEKIGVSVSVAGDEKTLFKKFTHVLPNILLIDDTACESGVCSLLSDYFSYYTRSLTSSILICDELSQDMRVDFMLRGIEYFMVRPINITEIVARINAIVYFQKRVKTLVYYERNAGNIDKMEHIDGYLSRHIKKPIQKFIDYNISDASQHEIRKYMHISRKVALNVLAAVNAIHDSTQSLLRAHHGYEKQIYETLGQLFKKHFSLVSAAYGDETSFNSEHNIDSNNA